MPDLTVVQGYVQGPGSIPQFSTLKALLVANFPADRAAFDALDELEQLRTHLVEVPFGGPGGRLLVVPGDSYGFWYVVITVITTNHDRLKAEFNNSGLSVSVS